MDGMTDEQDLPIALLAGAAKAAASNPQLVGAALNAANGNTGDLVNMANQATGGHLPPELANVAGDAMNTLANGGNMADVAGGAAQGIVGNMAAKYLGEEQGQMVGQLAGGLANAGANFLGDKMADMMNGQPAPPPTAAQPQAPGNVFISLYF